MYKVDEDPNVVAIQFFPNTFQVKITQQNLKRSVWLWNAYIRWAKAVIDEIDVHMYSRYAVYEWKKFRDSLPDMIRAKKYEWSKYMYVRNKYFVLKECEEYVIRPYVDSRRTMAELESDSINQLYITLKKIDLDKGIAQSKIFNQRVPSSLITGQPDIDVKTILKDNVVFFDDDAEQEGEFLGDVYAIRNGLKRPAPMILRVYSPINIDKSMVPENFKPDQAIEYYIYYDRNNEKYYLCFRFTDSIMKKKWAKSALVNLID